MLTRRNLFLLLCLFLLYISWGTAFIGNKFALEYIPGFLLVGTRFILAGLILLAYTYIRQEASRITLDDIKYSLVNGFFLVVVSSGFVSKAQESVPSGLAAILYGAAPIWLILGQWLLWGGKKPTVKQGLGLLLGFGALLWLNFHKGIEGDVSLWGLFMIFVATFAWIYGSHVSQVHQVDTTLSVIRGTGLLLLLGGLETVLLGLAVGERVDIFALPSIAYGYLAYLTLFSSIAGYTCYLWLLVNSRPIVAISYEYVVPAVAILLGGFLANESLDAPLLLASAVLLFSVFLIISHDRA